MVTVLGSKERLEQSAHVPRSNPTTIIREGELDGLILDGATDRELMLPVAVRGLDRILNLREDKLLGIPLIHVDARQFIQPYERESHVDFAGRFLPQAEYSSGGVPQVHVGRPDLR